MLQHFIGRRVTRFEECLDKGLTLEFDGGSSISVPVTRSCADGESEYWRMRREVATETTAHCDIFGIELRQRTSRTRDLAVTCRSLTC